MKPSEAYAAQRKLALALDTEKKRAAMASRLNVGLWKLSGACLFLVPFITYRISWPQSIVAGVLCLVLAELIAINAKMRV